MSAPTPSEAVRVAVQALDDLKIEAKQFARAAVESALSRPSDRVSDPSKLLLECFKRIDALAALSLHAGDAVFDVEAMLKACVPGGDHCDPQQVADALRAYLGATPAGSGSAGSAPSPSVSAAEAAPIPGAEPALHKREFDAEGFYAALKRAVRARSVTWKTVSEATGVSQTTLTRMSQGRRPDAASLAALSAWAGLNAAHFMPSSPAYGLGSAAVARGMEAREGQDPQGLGGEAIERGPEDGHG